MKKFLLVNDVDILGCLDINHGKEYDNPRKNCLRAVLKETRIDYRRCSYQPGYKSYKEEFFQCPLSICYVQLNNIETHRKEYEQYEEIQLEIIVFSKDFNKTRTFNLELSTNFMAKAITKIINHINNYVSYGNDINALDESFLQDRNKMKGLTIEKLVSQINDLRFEFFDNSEMRVGKDNTFWIEVVIGNLPENDYLSSLYYAILKRDRRNRTVKLYKTTLFIIYRYDQGYCGVDGKRTTRSPDIEKLSEIKDYLKINILKDLDLTIDINEKSKKRK